MDGADDFGNLGARVSAQEQKKRKVFHEGGSERPWLKVYETLPPQLLNAYGEAKYARMAGEKVWGELREAAEDRGQVYDGALLG